MYLADLFSQMAKQRDGCGPSIILAIISNSDLRGMSSIKLTTMVEKPVNATGA